MDNYGYDDYDYDDQESGTEKSLKGYKIIIIILAVILAALSLLYFGQTRSMKEDFLVERDTLTNRLIYLMEEYEGLETTNDTIARNLDIEKDRADSLLQRLTQERNFSYSKIRQYEKELGTMRVVMRNYVHQIDSLNTLNKELVTQVSDYRQRVTTQTLRAERAEEKADELTTKVTQGAVIRARDIALIPLNRNDREVTRARRAERLRIDFVLAANELAQPGSRSVYARITGPDGYIMANQQGAMFDFEGERRTYSAQREVDYQNEDLGVSIYFDGGGITDGKYSVEIYIDGRLAGSTEIIMR